MATLLLLLHVEDDDETIDPGDDTGVTNETFERLTGISGQPPLSWLGDVQETHLVLGREVTMKDITISG